MPISVEKLRKKLLAAISIGNFQKVEKCVEEAESEHIKNEVLNSREHVINPLRLATQKRNLRILRFLITKGGDINVTISTVYLSTPLHIAAAANEAEVAQFLLDNGANINATNYKGFTPLYLASFYCYLDMVKLLLFNNADTSIKDVNGKTASDVVGGYRRNMCDSDSRRKIASMLEHTAKVSSIGTIQTVLEMGNNYSTTDVTSKKAELFIDELFAAINRGNFQKVEKCIKEAESIGIKSEILSSERHGIKPIHFTTDKCDLKILQLLLNEGADINATNTEYFNTSLHIAAINGKLEIAQFLIDSGANINATNYKGFTPLYLASFHCQSDMVKLLFCNNADINIKDVNGRTASDVIGGYRRDMCNNSSEMQRVISILSGAVSIDCKAILTSTRVSLKEELEASSVVSNAASSAVKPSSFINSIFSWITASTLGRNIPALPSAQQSIAHSTGSSIGSSQVDFNGTALLTDVIVRKLTGKKYSKPLEDSLLTIEEIRAKKVNAIKEKFDIAINKVAQCPRSLLSNLTISKGVCHQKSL
ncbi:MAG: ankyrin repeat domain-containing protein [Wolbachia endosymbiont of Homalodisca vitripennis]|nr:ankyrin repeat domain-containing protein [Wolbachia endosymbiont of Homalodisca vitripennis]MCJ7454364.1 ankyrin repeat domain-containing protein [Wolbachia endosymbiont of Homalodisca vitripennis]MCJ7476418.1 ankyrin repeat domain-containing protein [Wolbachia endosymbiont of Homalodisca vitripennis]